MLVADLLQRVSDLLYDAAFDHWTKPELVRWLNDGQRAVVRLKPDAYVLHANHDLVEGTLQQIPADGEVFQRVLRNLGTSGEPGRAVAWVDIDTLDDLRPGWHADKAVAEVRHFLYDPGDPTRFYVWPPQPDPPGKAEIVYTASPPDCANPDNDAQAAVELGDRYTGPLIDYVAYRALSKQGKQTPTHLQAATRYYNQFAAALGAQQQGEAATEPGRRRRE